MTGWREADDLSDTRPVDADAHLTLEGKGGRARGDRPESVRPNADELALTRWSVLPMGATPLWMRAALAYLESAFPAFSFAVSRGWRGLRFEAWRDTTTDGLYAVITDDPSELWNELEMAQR
jgi:hypothetical protein